MTGPLKHAAGPAAALGLLTAIWGYNWVVIKVALGYASPLTFSALRSAGGAVALFLVLMALRRPLAPVRGGSMVLLGLLQTTGFVGLVALALESGTVGKSAVLAYTMPFWTLLLAGPLLGERVRGLQWLATGLAGIGLVGILSPWQSSLDVGASVLSIAAAWCWAASNIVVKRMALGSEELLNVSAWQMAVGAVGLGALAWTGDAEAVRFTGAFTLALVYNIVLATALAWMLWIFALSRLSAGATGLAALGAPVFSLFAAWLQLGELPTRWEAAGMGLILAALGVLSLGGRRRFSRARIA